MLSYNVSLQGLPYGRNADGKNNVWTVRKTKITSKCTATGI